MKTKILDYLLPNWFPCNNLQVLQLEEHLGVERLRWNPPVPTQANIHAYATHIGMKLSWQPLTPAQRKQRMANGLHRFDVIERAEAARRPKLKGPAHRKRVSEGMKRYWRRRHAQEAFGNYRQL
jgi:hypothetical protein